MDEEADTRWNPLGTKKFDIELGMQGLRGTELQLDRLKV